MLLDWFEKYAVRPVPEEAEAKVVSVLVEEVPSSSSSGSSS